MKKNELTNGNSMLLEKKVFVYGSLREGFHNYQKYLVDRVEKSELGIVQGELFDLEGLGYPALLHGSNQVAGEILTLKGDVTTLLKELDELECYFGENNPTNEYDKKIVGVFNTVTQQEEQLPVYFYNMNNPDVNKDIMISISDGDWKKYTEKKIGKRKPVLQVEESTE